VVRRAVVDFLAPARFDDALSIRVRTAHLGNRSARLEYIVDNSQTGLRPVVAETVLACVEISSMRSMPWPQFWRQRVMEFEGENLRIGQQ
jgi:acyl-CoA thioester hydrolase